MNCLNCNKEVKQIEGKRQRKYCDDACKQIHWKKTNKKEPKYVQYKTFKELLDKFNSLSERDNQLINAARGRDECGVNLDEMRPSKQKDNKTQDREVKKENKATETTNEPIAKVLGIYIPDGNGKMDFIEPKLSDADRKEITQQIAETKAELKSPPKSPIIGLRMWTKIREDKIKELENKLK